MAECTYFKREDGWKLPLLQHCILSNFMLGYEYDCCDYQLFVFSSFYQQCLLIFYFRTSRNYDVSICWERQLT